MNERVKLIVLDRKDYKEYDVLIPCFVENVGVVTLLAKGANRPTSKYGSLLQPTYELDALIDLKKGLSLFKSASLIKHFEKIETSLHALSITSFLCKILANNAIDEKQLIDYALLKQYFELMDDKNALSLGTHFLSTLAKSMGVNFYVDGCVICNAPHIVALSTESGGFLCKQHAHLSNMPTQEKHFYQHLRCLSKARIDQLKMCEKPTSLQHMQIYVEMLQQILSIPQKNWHFIQQI